VAASDEVAVADADAIAVQVRAQLDAGRAVPTVDPAEFPSLRSDFDRYHSVLVRTNPPQDTDGMRKERILREAEFAPNAVRYHVMATMAAMTLMVVGIPLIPIVAPLVYWYYSRHYRRLSVRLTSRELKVRRGILVVEEKSIPLEKITDLAVYEGPIMRAMGLKGIRVETAGQTTTTGSALVSVIGIVDTDDFRDLVLEQRDRIADRDDALAVSPAGADSPALAGAPAVATPTIAVTDPALIERLTEIRDLLRQIEAAVARGATPADPG
jgi:putative membrane protein